jgi:hypothetical protein
MSADVLAQIVHRFATQVRVGGTLCLSSNGDPALVAAFKALGWSEPYPIEPSAFVEPAEEAATVEAPERAVMPSPRGRRG